MRRLLLGVLAAACVAGTIVVPVPGPAANAVPSRPAQSLAPVSGAGSSYVAGAMSKWTAEIYAQGPRVNYQQGSSPEGLDRFRVGNIDFAGTEAEFSSMLGLGNDSQVTRGFQYVPDVAGAVAIMYNIRDRAGNKVNYLRLRRETVARIFLGDITNWSDPAITADLGGQIVLPDRPIQVVYRGGPSGTTALFYDFVQSMAPDLFDRWVERNNYPRGVRIIDPGISNGFLPNNPIAKNGSDAMAIHVRDNEGTISYDEFSFALRFNVATAWIENQAGNWVQPYALNISQALEAAHLRPDLSQELSGVYRSPLPEAYPISAYSYLVTPCAPAPDRATCRGNYPDEGKARTMERFMDHIACDGQVGVDRIGYSPLPPNLSQEMQSSIQRMWGRPVPQAKQLTQGNCRNPRFDPNWRPLAAPAAPPLPPAVDEAALRSGNTSRSNTASTEAAAADATATDEAAAAGRDQSRRAVGGGSDDWRGSNPVGFNRPGLGPIGAWALVALLLLLAAPLMAGPLWRKLKRS